MIFVEIYLLEILFLSSIKSVVIANILKSHVMNSQKVNLMTVVCVKKGMMKLVKEMIQEDVFRHQPTQLNTNVLTPLLLLLIILQ